MLYQEIFRASGSVAEWSKALVLGTSHFDGVGSNPTAARKSFFRFFLFLYPIYVVLVNLFNTAAFRPNVTKTSNQPQIRRHHVFQVL